MPRPMDMKVGVHLLNWYTWSWLCTSMEHQAHHGCTHGHGCAHQWSTRQHSSTQMQRDMMSEGAQPSDGSLGDVRVWVLRFVKRSSQQMGDTTLPSPQSPIVHAGCMEWWDGGWTGTVVYALNGCLACVRRVLHSPTVNVPQQLADAFENETRGSGHIAH